MIEPYLHKAQYYETDQMGVIHHSNYLRWFEEARVDWLDRLGIGYDGLEAEGIIIPVLSATCEYKSMVRFGDTVAIHLCISALSGSRMTVGYRILDAATGELRTMGTTSHCFLKKEGRPVSLKKACPRVYEALAASCTDK